MSKTAAHSFDLTWCADRARRTPPPLPHVIADPLALCAVISTMAVGPVPPAIVVLLYVVLLYVVLLYVVQPCYCVTSVRSPETARQTVWQFGDSGHPCTLADRPSP